MIEIIPQKVVSLRKINEHDEKADDDSITGGDAGPDLPYQVRL